MAATGAMDPALTSPWINPVTAPRREDPGSFMPMNIWTIWGWPM